MQLLSIEPFIPSGPDFEKSKSLFLELGFQITFDAGDYVGFKREACQFILQKYDNKEFAENLMISVKVDSAEDFYAFIQERQLTRNFGVRITEPRQQPYGKEVNLIDIAGVCWHFVE